jgi:hypothetical protein
MLEAIGFLITIVFVLFVGLLGVAGFLILVVFIVVLPASIIIRLLTPDPLD